MRTIKFRAWDKENKKMVDVIDFSCMNYPDKYKVMQFTGLKDKNGVEIYEGDIVEFRKHKAKDSHIRIGEVYFANGDIAQFRIKWFEDEFEREKSYPSTTDFNLREVKVIGDIYQNKELLKK